MTRLVTSALLVAALSAPLALGASPAAAAESATASTLITIKGDRGTHNPTATMILATIAAESN